jgi:hypothetical protein
MVKAEKHKKESRDIMLFLGFIIMLNMSVFMARDK